MTVSELIEALQKFPPYCIVVIESEDKTHIGLGVEMDLTYIGDVKIQSNVGDLGNVVKIIQEIS